MRFTALTAMALSVLLIAGCGGSSSGSRDSSHTHTYRVPTESMVPTLKMGQIVTVNLDAYKSVRPKIGDLIVLAPPASQSQSTISHAAVCGDYEHALRDGYRASRAGQSVVSRLKALDYQYRIISRVIAAIGRSRVAPHIQHGAAPCGLPDRHPARDPFVKRIVAGPGDTISIVAGHAIVNGKRQADAYIKACSAGEPCDFPRATKIPAGHWFVLGDNRGESEDSRFWGPVPTQWIIGRVKQ